ncbi:hypothetical protein IG631_05785 [Alternaria alternata]|nr:hypothetical protein IG631_05785 [Alternaria alternata]
MATTILQASHLTYHPGHPIVSCSRLKRSRRSANTRSSCACGTSLHCATSMRVCTLRMGTYSPRPLTGETIWILWSRGWAIEYITVPCLSARSSAVLLIRY